MTPAGIRQTGAEVITYGAPVAPGFMLLAYLGDVPILGLPGCVMHDKVTSFDLVLPRLLAGEKLSRSDLIRWGCGGFVSKVSGVQVS